MVLNLAVPKPLKLGQSEEELVAQIDAFLGDKGFPVDEQYRKLTAQLLQAGGDESDEVDLEKLASRMRRLVANAALFFIIHPDRKPTQKEEPNVEATEATPPTQEANEVGVGVGSST